MHPVVFSREWFERHQRLFLTLLALPLIGRVMRRVLAIRSCDVGYRGRIVELLPHAYVVDNGDGTVTADFRTHDKYARRLYYQLLPLWQALHAWDQAIANPFAPALNVGFDTLTAYPEPDPATVAGDAIVQRAFVSESWGTLRAGAGTGVTAGQFGNNFFRFDADTTLNVWTGLYRSIFCFDTHSIGGNTITAATLSTWVYGKDDPGGLTPDIDVFEATLATAGQPAAVDFANVGSVSLSGTVAYAAIVLSGYTNYVLNSTGRATVNVAGVTTLAHRNVNYDVSNVAPTWTSGQITGLNGHPADQTGSANDPKLVVTYTTSRFAPRNNLRPRAFAPGRAR